MQELTILGYFTKYNEARLAEIGGHEIIKVAELEGLPFIVEEIRFKEKLVTEFGTKDAYILDVNISPGTVGPEMRTVFINQTALMSKVAWMKENGGYEGVMFTFRKRVSERRMNVYWDIDVFAETEEE